MKSLFDPHDSTVVDMDEFHEARDVMKFAKKSLPLSNLKPKAKPSWSVMSRPTMRPHAAVSLAHMDPNNIREPKGTCCPVENRKVIANHFDTYEGEFRAVTVAIRHDLEYKS